MMYFLKEHILGIIESKRIIKSGVFLNHLFQNEKHQLNKRYFFVFKKYEVLMEVQKETPNIH